MVELAKYHVTFEDPFSGEFLGLILTESGGPLGRVAQLANPYAAKVGAGDRSLSDLTDLSVYEQTDWRAGRGQDQWEEEDRFFDARGLETRISGQVTLGPLSIATGVGDIPEYIPVSVDAVSVGYLSADQQLRSQSFEAPTGGLSCTHVTLKVRKSASATRAYKVTIQADDTGDPSGTPLRTKTFDLDDLSTSFEEHEFTWTAYSLASETVYHIVVEHTDDKLSSVAYLEVAADGTASYADGSAHYKPPEWTVGKTLIAGSHEIDSADWAADAARDFWFKVNDGQVLAGAITVNPVRFNDAWYCAADDTVYKWSGTVWESSDVQADETVTDLLVWGDYLWTARGANTMRYLSTVPAWDDVPGAVQSQLLTEYQGYLYRTDPTDKEKVYYSADGTNWSSAINVGPGDWDLTGLCGFRDEVALVNEVGLWLLNVIWAYQVLDWKSLEESTNGRGAMTWAKSNELFMPVAYGLYRWTGATMVACGPDQDAGLPADRAGVVAALCGTVNWLYAAVDAGASGRSSIMAYTGRGWHEILRAQNEGSRIRALGYDTVSSPPRLWYGAGDVMYYTEMPDFSDNPYAYSGLAFAADGEIDLSTWGSELVPVVKDLRALVVQAEDCATGQVIDVYYEIDRSGIWMLVGSVADARVLHTVAVPGSSFTTKTVGSGSTTTTIELNVAGHPNTGDLSPGDWVRISSEIRQIQSITDSDTFVLALPLTTAPSAGVQAYASSPAGSELRIRARLSTDDSSKTPKLLALAAYCDANITDRWSLTLNVKVADDTKTLDDSKYPMNAAALRVELKKWITRRTPFTLHDIDGQQVTVKVANAAEVNMTRGDRSPPSYSSIFRIGLIEVEVKSG